MVKSAGTQTAAGNYRPEVVGRGKPAAARRTAGHGHYNAGDGAADVGVLGSNGGQNVSIAERDRGTPTVQRYVCTDVLYMSRFSGFEVKGT